MSVTPFFTSLELAKVKPLPAPTDFDVYENYYFATDIETLVSNISNEVNSLLRQGYGLLNDEFLVRSAVLNRDSSKHGVCVRLKFYRPRHFETFCKIGQERSKFHEKYFEISDDYLSGNISAHEFIDSLKQLENENHDERALYTQEYILFTSPQSYDESIPEHIYKAENGMHPYIEMYVKAKTEAAKMFDDSTHFIDYYMCTPVVNETLYHTSTNNFIVFVGMYRLKPLTIDEAIKTYTFDKPSQVKKSDTFYKQFSKISLLYLLSDLSADEVYTKLITLEKEAA